MRILENSFSIEKATILSNDFVAATDSFEAITTYETAVDSQDYAVWQLPMAWQLPMEGDWVWGFNRDGNWGLLSIGEYNTPDTVIAILEAIAPYLVEANITMLDNNSNGIKYSLIRFIVKNGVVYQQNADNYWPAI